MSTKDPRKIYAQPPYPEKKQPSPASDEEMSPEVDHGESSYKGTGRLTGRHALITGADSGIGRAAIFKPTGAFVARLSMIRPRTHLLFTSGRRLSLF
jgi:hypothetical protein